MLIFAENMIFGALSESAGAQNGAQNRPSGAKMAPFQGFGDRLSPNLEPACFQDRFWNAPGRNFGRLGQNWDEIMMTIWHRYARFSAALSRA